MLVYKFAYVKCAYTHMRMHACMKKKKFRELQRQNVFKGKKKKKLKENEVLYFMVE